MIYKHLKRAIPKRLFTALTLVLLLAGPLHAQTRADTARTELVRSRGFIRAAETQLSKVLGLLDPAPAGPPTVLDWRTGEWDVLAGGYRGVLDLTYQTATINGVTAPVTSVAAGDTLRVGLRVPGLEDGLLELVHAEGRMIGTVMYDTIVRPASAQRPSLERVSVVKEGACTFVLYTDGSWGVAPNAGGCHAVLVERVGGLKFVARNAEEL